MFHRKAEAGRQRWQTWLTPASAATCASRTKPRRPTPPTVNLHRCSTPAKCAWRDHFCWSRDTRLIVGLTPTGRATVAALSAQSPVSDRVPPLDDQERDAPSQRTVTLRVAGRGVGSQAYPSGGAAQHQVPGRVHPGGGDESLPLRVSFKFPQAICGMIVKAILEIAFREFAVKSSQTGRICGTIRTPPTPCRPRSAVAGHRILISTKVKTDCRSQSLGYRQVEADPLGLGFGVNGAGQSVSGGVRLLKERSYDGTLDFFPGFLVFPGISCGDAAFLYQCLTQQPFFRPRRGERDHGRHNRRRPPERPDLECLRPGQARRCLG